jgi:hypothetical protein
VNTSKDLSKRISLSRFQGLLTIIFESMATKKLTFKISIIVATLFLACNLYAQEYSKGNEEEEEIESTQCGGTERWSVKVMTDAAASTVNMTGISANVAYMVGISTPTPSTTMPRYTGVEDKTYSVTCNITLKKVETDNDYHLVMSDGTHTMIGEIPDPTCSAAASSAFVNEYIAARNFIDAHIASGNVSSVNISPVIIYGVAFVDPPHGQTGAAPNNLEIHPILHIQFAGTTDINDQQTEILHINVFPNPATDKLTIQINSKVDKLNNCEFQVFNAMGSLVKEIDLPRASYNLNYTYDLDELSSGLYYYRVTKTGKPLYEGKFIKN